MFNLIDSIQLQNNNNNNTNINDSDSKEPYYENDYENNIRETKKLKPFSFYSKMFKETPNKRKKIKETEESKNSNLESNWTKQHN